MESDSTQRPLHWLQVLALLSRRFIHPLERHARSAVAISQKNFRRVHCVARYFGLRYLRCQLCDSLRVASVVSNVCGERPKEHGYQELIFRPHGLFLHGHNHPFPSELTRADVSTSGWTSTV